MFDAQLDKIESDMIQAKSDLAHMDKCDAGTAARLCDVALGLIRMARRDHKMIAELIKIKGIESKLAQGEEG